MSNEKRPGARSTGSGAAGSKRPLMIAAIAGVVVVVALVVAVLTTGKDKGSSSSTATTVAGPANVITEGELASFTDAATDPAVGQMAPWLTGREFSGKQVRVFKDGRPKVIVFLAHWCPHCQRELPVLVQWLAANPQTDVDVYAVATAIDPTRPNYPPQPWIEGAGWPGKVIVDPDNAAAAAYGLSGFPYFVTVDADQKVKARRSGELPESEIAALFAQLQPAA